MGVIQNYALFFLSVIGIGLFAPMRASDIGLISWLEKSHIVLNYTHLYDTSNPVKNILMHCMNCYTKIIESAKFCSNCGTLQLNYRISHEEWLASVLPGSFRETITTLVEMYNEVRISNYVLASYNPSCLERLVINRLTTHWLTACYLF